MSLDYEIDKLDREILTILQEDSRIPFQEIARKLIISGGTVHVRVNKLKNMGIIKGSRILIDYSEMGYDVTAFIGVNQHNAGDYNIVLKQMKKMTEITEIHYTTGTYSLFIKVRAKSTHGLHLFLINNLQTISEIQSTETFISLDTPVKREIPLL